MGYVAAQIFKRSNERKSKCACCCHCKQNAKTKQYYHVVKREDDWAVFRYRFVYDNVEKAYAAFGIPTREAAERIAAIYEEVMP